ncbi:probable carboxylesterase 17 [Oryza brachyantha]|uniref:probable carboxylesterase 17 n=1 Tax=Oryza brachyantha TaxID=4533 RepID=UPI001ADC3CBC|nr:probable carboxylesterase 17 [Oryza brachyantha]
MRWRRMGALHVGEPRVSFEQQQQQVGKNGQQGGGGHGHGAVVEEIHGLIRVYGDGYVERLPAIPDVPCTWGTTALPGVVVARDVVVDRATGVWARLYAPAAAGRVPVVVYFHGGGFCVGSAAWSCYHEFLAKMAARAGCAVMSVDYRLAPENRLPAAFDDGVTAVRWLRQQAAICNGAISDELSWWRGRCRFDRVFLAGDSAGATIAFHVASRLSHLGALTPLDVKGAILIQPFFGGEARTASEKTTTQPPGSALTLSTSDTYWRMSLPAGATRDHPWCNPVTGRGAPRLDALPLPSFLVCISEQDILRDRNLELCRALRKAGKSVEQATYGGVGHAFQVLNNYHLSQPRTQEMLAHIKAFVTAR